MSKPIQILLVDDSELVRRGIRSVLEAHRQPPLHVVGEAANVADAVAACLRLKPDIVLLDIRLPDGSGFDVCRRILPRLPNTRVIVLTAHSDDHSIYEAVTSGAQGYLLKEVDPTGLIQGIIDVAAGHSILDPDTTTRVLRLLRDGASTSNESNLAHLSTQERKVLAFVADGKTNKEIAGQLNLSENTVKNYLVNVFEKLKIKRRSQAAALFVQHNTPAKSTSAPPARH
jgi:two-component system response regulator DevR